jgi:hypothetical protein
MRLGRRERVLEQCVDEPPSVDCDHERARSALEVEGP